MNINNSAALGNSTFTIISGTIDNTSAGAITLNNNVQNWNGDFTFTGTNDLDMGTGAVAMNATRAVNVANGNFTLGGNISGSTFGLTKNGSGTMVLSGANTYNGTTEINAGTLAVSGGSAIADTSAVAIGSGDVFALAANETVGSIAGAGNVTLGSNTLTAGGDNSSTTLSGIISGTGSLTKTGSGALTLSGASTYTWNLNQKITLIPEVRMFWQHEFLNNARNINASLGGENGASFNFETTDPYRDSVFAGAGVTAQFHKNLSGSIFYNVNFGSQTYQSNMLSVGLNMSF